MERPGAAARYRPRALDRRWSDRGCEATGCVTYWYQIACNPQTTTSVQVKVRSSTTGIGITLPRKCRPLTPRWWLHEASADCRYGRERGRVRKCIHGQRIRYGE